MSALTAISGFLDLSSRHANREGLVEATSREARLRPEFASGYPDLSPTRWYPVATLVRLVARQLVRGDTGPVPRLSGSRPLDDDHFEFRGGVDRDATWRTRAGDTSVWPYHPRS